MPVFLSALGWVTDEPRGNRLRWAVPVDEVVDGAFRGLPVSVLLERSLLPPTGFGDTVFFDTPSWPIPLDWWEPLGDLSVGFGLAVRLALPKPVQAVRFVYQGPENRLRVFTPAGEAVMIRALMPGQIVLIESTDIAGLEFLIGGATLLQASILDLFAGHDAGVNFEQIAVLNPGATATMGLAAAEARLSGPSGIEPGEWAAFQAEIAAAAIASLPDVAVPAFAGIERWAQFSALVAVRWRHSLLYGFGFLDGPEAGPGTAADAIASDLLLQEMPTRPVIYRVRCRFADGSLLTSNPVVVPPMPASPLATPQDLAYESPRVRLFEGDEYLFEARLTLGANDRRVRGVEIEEEFGASPILATAAIPGTYLFQSWEPADSSQRMRINRAATLPFYDLPVSCRARSLDIWDRASAWSMRTPPVLAVFEHSPLPPALLDARLKDGLVTLFPRLPDNSFASWEPDHAAANTPGAVLEVMQRASEPAIVEIPLGQSEFASSVQDDRLALPGAFPGAASQPGTFRGRLPHRRRDARRDTGDRRGQRRLLAHCGWRRYDGDAGRGYGAPAAGPQPSRSFRACHELRREQRARSDHFRPWGAQSGGRGQDLPLRAPHRHGDRDGRARQHGGGHPPSGPAIHTAAVFGRGARRRFLQSHHDPHPLRRRGRRRPLRRHLGGRDRRCGRLSRCGDRRRLRAAGGAAWA